MAKRKPRPGFRFPGPVPREALEYFDAKDLRVGFSHRDVSGLEHAHAFTAAKVSQLDILEDLKGAIREHLADGKTFESFRRELTPVLQAKGWWGRKAVIDPKTGKTVEAQLGSPRRLKTIFRSNIRAARAAGQWARIQRTKGALPYLLYQLGPSREHRDEHVAWRGTLLPADDDWWRDHYPPNGWGCKCWVRQVSEAEAGRLGGPADPPSRDMREWTNPRTGLRMQVDRGLDPAWASNPGLDRERILADSLVGALDAADAALAREAVRQAVESPLLERQLAPPVTGAPPHGDLPIGYLEREWRGALRSRTALARMTSRTAEKQAGKHPDITAAAYRLVLPSLFRDADLVYREPARDGEGTDLVFVRQFGDGTVYRAAVRRHDERRVSLTTVHRIKVRDARAAAKRGDRLRDRRGWSRSPGR